MKQTLILDSTQLSTFCECPEKWNLSDGMNLIQINKAHPELTNQPSDAIAMGSLGHKYLEIYYTEIGHGRSTVESYKKAVAFKIPEGSSDFPLDEEKRTKVKNRFNDYIARYNLGGDYKVSSKKQWRIYLNPSSGLLEDSFENVPLIEQGFSYNLFESNEYLFVLEGKVDFIGEAPDGSVLWMDHKFQLRAHDLYSKSIQFRNYSLALGIPLAVINYIRLTDKMDYKTTFVRQPITFSFSEMKQWREELIEIYIQIARMKREEKFRLNRSACGSKFSSFHCQFTQICEQTSPEAKNGTIQLNYTKKKEWRPW